jgi:hypothetical protein
MDTAAPTRAVREPRSDRMIAATVLGILALLFIAAGITGIWARFGSSEHGYITSGSHRYATSGRAIVSGSLDVDGVPDWLVSHVRVSASADDNRALFVGVARRAAVDRYLAGVAHSTVEDVNFDPFNATYSTTAGNVVPARPAAQTFWAASKAGTGKQTVTWRIRNGNWRVVVMNADGSPRVVADAKAGASVRGAVAIVFSLLGVGLALAAIAGTLVLRAIRRR